MLLQAKHIFFVGIKGVAMANLAIILKQQGKHVLGSDTEEHFITNTTLQAANISWISLTEKLPTNVDLVIYSAAHGGLQSSQVQQALSSDIPVLHQAAALQEILSEFVTAVAVAGCHGKTTTSALLAYALTQLKTDPGYMVGVSEFNGLTGGHAGIKDYFIVEADEYALDPPTDKTPKFHFLHPTDAIITNIDFDHPDVYKNIQAVKEAFKKFIDNVLKSEVRSEKLENAPQIVICLDDTLLDELAKTLPKSKYITYGFDSRADIRIEHLQTTETESTMNIIYNLKKYSFTLDIFGEKNALNAAGVIGYLLIKGFDPMQIQNAMQGFTGAKRRFEQVAFVNNTYLFDDYAHHPQEIAATIQAARARFPDRRVVVIFQSHTYSRTESLKNEFIHALAQADLALIAPIFASAREQQSDDMITAEKLAVIAHESDIRSILGYNTKEGLINSLQYHIKRGDVIFTMGAGDVYKLSNNIIPYISNDIT